MIGGKNNKKEEEEEEEAEEEEEERRTGLKYITGCAHSFQLFLVFSVLFQKAADQLCFRKRLIYKSSAKVRPGRKTSLQNRFKSLQNSDKVSKTVNKMSKTELKVSKTAKVSKTQLK